MVFRTGLFGKNGRLWFRLGEETADQGGGEDDGGDDDEDHGHAGAHIPQILDKIHGLEEQFRRSQERQNGHLLRRRNSG